MLMYCDGFMHVRFVSSLLDVCEEGGADGEGAMGEVHYRTVSVSCKARLGPLGPYFSQHPW